MKPFGRNSILGYCTNVHPGTSPDSIIKRIETDCLKVKTAIDPSINFGIGLWLPAQAAEAFKNFRTLALLKQACERSQIRIFSWNAFPYFDFHQPRVKEQVYSPNWSELSRLHYTLNLLDIIRDLSFDLDEVSISSLPIAYRDDRLNSTSIETAVSHLIEFAKASFSLERTTGVDVHLDLEPEPLCYLEKSTDAVMFFKDFLLPLGVKRLSKELGLTRTDAESLLLRKICICYDTCHAAVLHETPQEVLRNYDSLGIKVGKVQISSALIYHPELTVTPESSTSYRLLTELSSDRYLHQVVGMQPDRKLESFPDLPEALAVWKYSTSLAAEYRIHYHVPVFLNAFECLRTTQDHIKELFSIAQTRTVTAHWEVETYTWPSLPQTQYREISDGIVEELNWVRKTAQERQNESE